MAQYFDYGAEQALKTANYHDVFSCLGMHPDPNQRGLIVRAWLQGAERVEVHSLKDDRKVAELECIDADGIFAGRLGRRVNRFAYRLQVHYPSHSEAIIDPYQFPSLLTEQELHLFAEGQLEQGWKTLGANWRQHQGVTGVLFVVWAPNAQRVSVVADFNQWDGSRHVMRFHPQSGLWEIFIPQAKPEQFYKYQLIGADGVLVNKADPWARSMEAPPCNASRIPTNSDYQWQDQQWLAARANTQWHQQPIAIYEVQLGSWRKDDQQQFLDYDQLIEQLLPYVKQLGFTHLQLMPISEYPFDGSWGYQPVGMFAPTHRFGDGDGLRRFIDACHQQQIAVLLDWVPAHFPRDPHGLAQFDGTALYEHADSRQGHHPDWDTLIYNYGRDEVQSYLLSAANYWLQEFHFDGLRLDAVSSMLYLDYSRQPGQWLPNAQGGRENLEAIAFLQNLNRRLYQANPGILMIAEESTAWPGVTQTVDQGGLGFGFKWNMGWMHDNLQYLQQDPIYRCYHHNKLTFGLLYGYSEQFILPISHDEVVHGKGSMLAKIAGDDWQQFATLRAFYGLMWGHPGKKHLFMGSEFAQRNEWDHQKPLDWQLLDSPWHHAVKDWLADLNRLYQSEPALYCQDHQPQGFQWLDCDNASDSVISFVRRDDSGGHLLFVVNMTPQVHHGFRIGLPEAVNYRERLNSDSEYYGGSNVGNQGEVIAEAHPYQGQSHSALITVPPLACVVLAPQLPQVVESPNEVALA
ncbi:1,4-alpha-glucan branching protein GlgB [Ferrimonas senticii]|uniref:1,4-alpha-glucan branching protein GlgB n=1 Tax=Ferrimonas senticii TaxID=394566 RepID=UPI00040A9588|nr:1,4-alpha-glucan branching protein GlgB [Ferrimonas senticii]